jgi:hypothetical protein
LEASRTRQNSLEIIVHGNMAEQCVALSEEERDRHEFQRERNRHRYLFLLHTEKHKDSMIFHFSKARASEHTETCANDSKNFRSSKCIYRDRNKTETETRQTDSRQSVAWEQGRIDGAVGGQQD